jgi:hypothetical protein
MAASILQVVEPVDRRAARGNLAGACLWRAQYARWGQGEAQSTSHCSTLILPAPKPAWQPESCFSGLFIEWDMVELENLHLPSALPRRAPLSFD